MKYIGIKDGKVFDMLDNLANKRDPDDESVQYIEVDPKSNIIIDDTWDDEEQMSLLDSPHRIPTYVKSDIETLQEKIIELEERIVKLEGVGGDV